MSQSLFRLQCHCPKMWYKKITLLTGSESEEVNQGTAGKWLGTGIIWNFFTRRLVPESGLRAGCALLGLLTRLHTCGDVGFLTTWQLDS